MHIMEGDAVRRINGQRSVAFNGQHSVAIDIIICDITHQCQPVPAIPLFSYPAVVAHPIHTHACNAEYTASGVADAAACVHASKGRQGVEESDIMCGAAASFISWPGKQVRTTSLL